MALAERVEFSCGALHLLISFVRLHLPLVDVDQAGRRTWVQVDAGPTLFENQAITPSSVVRQQRLLKSPGAGKIKLNAMSLVARPGDFCRALGAITFRQWRR